MEKYNISEIMKRAWEIKKENSKNIFSICLQMAWKEAKSSKVVDQLTKMGYKVWEKHGMKRIYINSLESLVPSDKNPKGYRKVSMYYDISADEFVTSGVTRSAKATVCNVIDSIRKAA